MFEIISSKTNINFIGYRRYLVGLSILSIIGVVVLFFTKGLNYGIDFKGGAEVQLKFNTTQDVGLLRNQLETAGIKNSSIQVLGSGEPKEFLVKMGGEEAELQRAGDLIGDVLKKNNHQFEIVRVDVVGPQAGEELRKSGIFSTVYALLFIFIWVALRFDSRYSPGAVLALLHDSFLTLGVFMITQKEFSLQILAAILTIIGYSNNDTIIVFDRVREVLKLHPERSLEENVNRSINETLGRTILTSLNTFLVTFSLYWFGSGVIKDFAFTMCVGIVVGTYSSVFIASPIFIMISNWQKKSSGSKVAVKTSRAPLQARP